MARPSSHGGRMGNPFEHRLKTIRCIDESGISQVLALFGPERHFDGKRGIARDAMSHNRIMVLTEGWACRYRLLPDGRRQIVMLLLPGDVCNPDVLAWSQTSYVVMSLTPCSVIEADATELQDLMVRSAQIAQAWMNLIFADNAMLAERNACLGRRSAREHLAHFLCELFIRLRRVGRATIDSFALRVTQEEIADTLGLTTVHVNRVLMVLRAEGMVSVQGQCVTILDWARLRIGGGFESRYLNNGTGTRPADDRASEPDRVVSPPCYPQTCLT
jgi:CRP-like cAMP-binding protein